MWLLRRSQVILDFMFAVVAVFDLIVFPARLAFAGAVGSSEPAWFGVLVLTDVVLWLDMLARFFTPVCVEGKLIYDRRAVVRTYLRGSFALDLVARLPWDGFMGMGSTGGYRFGYGHLARLLVLRRTLDITRDPGGRGGHGFVGPARRLALLLAVSLLGLHWYSCATWIVGESLKNAGLNSWLDQHWTPCTSDEAVCEHWADWPFWARYVRSVDRAALRVLGNDLGQHSHAETALGLVGTLVGIVWMAYFTGSMVQLLTTLNQASERSLARIAAVKVFCTNARLPVELASRVSAHLEYVLLVKKGVAYDQALLHELSSPLRVEVALQRCRAFLTSPKFLESIGMARMVPPTQFLKRLVAKMVHVVFSPGDFVIEEGELGHEVYFLSAGELQVVARMQQVARLRAGDCFGEIALLVPGVLRMASIVALTFCEAHMLARVDFEDCLRDFPDIARQIKVIAQDRLVALNAQLEQHEAQLNARARVQALQACDHAGMRSASPLHGDGPRRGSRKLGFEEDDRRGGFSRARSRSATDLAASVVRRSGSFIEAAAAAAKSRHISEREKEVENRAAGFSVFAALAAEAATAVGGERKLPLSAAPPAGDSQQQHTASAQAGAPAPEGHDWRRRSITTLARNASSLVSRQGGVVDTRPQTTGPGAYEA